MRAGFELISILSFISLCLVSVNAKSKVKPKHGPGGMSFNDSTSCEEFSRNARFNPYSVLYEQWFVFFYWAPPRSPDYLVFSFPTTNHTKHLHKILDGRTILPVNWTARQLLMENAKKEIYLLIERGDRGEYWQYPVIRVKGRKLRPRDVRLKQTGDNRLLGIMDCDEETVLVMSRIGEVPPKNNLYEEASRLGYRSRRGKSYLYQGHEWMPIPEDDEKHYWSRRKRNKGWKMASNKEDSSEQSGEKVKPKSADEPGKSQTVKKALEEENPNSSSSEEKLESKNDQVQRDLKNEPANLHLAKEQLDSQETNVRDVRSNDEPKKEPEKNMAEEPDNTQITKELERHRETNEPEKVQTTSVQGNFQLINENKQEEPRSTKDSNIPQCNDCNELLYIKSTDEPYISESTRSRNNLKNEQLTNEPESTEISKESVTLPSSIKEDIVPQADTEPSTSPEPPLKPVNSQLDN